MSSPNRRDRLNLRLARPADSDAIRRVLEEGSYPGSVEVHFTRRPDVYASYQRDGEALVMPVAEDPATGEIVGAGGCVLRRAYVNGSLETTGYLTGLKLLEPYRRRTNSIRKAYEMMRRETRDDCRLYATTILSGNEQAIRFLEKPHRDMPPYRCRGEYTVFCLGTGRRRRPGAGLRLEQGSQGLADFYGRYLPDYNLAAPWDSLYGLSGEDFYSLRTAGGEILAACALWNQQSYKQYTVTRYSGILKPLSRLPAHLLGYPRIPREGVPARYASAAMLLARPDCADLAARFVELLVAQAADFDFFMAGLHESHPICANLDKLPHIKYKSRLYTVEYEGGLEPDGRPVMLEVGLL